MLVVNESAMNTSWACGKIIPLAYLPANHQTHMQEHLGFPHIGDGNICLCGDYKVLLDIDYIQFPNQITYFCYPFLLSLGYVQTMTLIYFNIYVVPHNLKVCCL